MSTKPLGPGDYHFEGLWEPGQSSILVIADGVVLAGGPVVGHRPLGKPKIDADLPRLLIQVGAGWALQQLTVPPSALVANGEASLVRVPPGVDKAVRAALDKVGGDVLENFAVRRQGMLDAVQAMMAAAIAHDSKQPR